MKTKNSQRLEQTTGKAPDEISPQSPAPQSSCDEGLNAETNFGWYIAAIVIAVLIMASALYFKPVF